MKDYQLTVLSNEKVSNRYWHMVVDSSIVDEQVLPGQFFNLQSATYGTYTPLLRRPFSIYRINQDTLEFLYKIGGPGTDKLTEYQVGDNINILGPLGVPFSIHPESKKMLLLARGVGIATLAALAQQAYQDGLEIYAILSARTNNDLLATSMMEEYCSEVCFVTEEDETSGVDHVRQIVYEWINEHDIGAAYTCGSQRLSVLLQEITNELNIKGEVALEEYMACGIGVCYSCVCSIQKDGNIHHVKSCEEGPVFSLKEVMFQ